MEESSKQELVQLMKRFGAFLTVKISKILPISLQNLVRTSHSFFFHPLISICDTHSKFHGGSAAHFMSRIRPSFPNVSRNLMVFVTSCYSFSFSELGSCLNITSWFRFFKKHWFTNEHWLKIMAVSDQENLYIWCLRLPEKNIDSHKIWLF